MTTVSIMERGAGSVERLRAARLAVDPLHLRERLEQAVLDLQEPAASVTEMPGRVIGM